MVDYATLKAAHVTLVVVSVAGLVARALPAIAWEWRARQRWLRTAPHVVDTLLLASGIWLILLVGWSPFAHPWLGVKLLLLVVYVALAALAMRPRFPRPVRALLLVAALATVAWMAAAAVSKSPWGLAAL